MTEHIAVFSKGGVGTSTLISNLSAALVEAGFRILQIGFSLKGDSCNLLNGGMPIPSAWDQYQKYGTLTFDTVVNRAFKDTYCIELGGPRGEPGTFGTLQSLDLLLEHDLITSLFPDFVLYDISGDQAGEIVHAICGKIKLHRVFAVTTADFASLHFVNSVMIELERNGHAHVPIPVPVPLGGLIPNGISSSFEESFISDFANRTGVHTLGKIPRSLIVRQCELYRKTVIEASPLSNQSYYYRRLANQIVDETRTVTIKHQPNPMTFEKLSSWAHGWADRLYAIENGLVSDGAAI